MKKKLLIGALIFSASLLASSGAWVMPVEHRVLASEAGGQPVVNQIDLTVEANGYQTVKLTNLANTNSAINLADNSQKLYKYAWVDNADALNSVTVWKDVPQAETDGASILIKDAEEGKYLAIKKQDVNIFLSKNPLSRHEFKQDLNIIKVSNKQDTFLISFGDDPTLFEYKEKTDGSSQDSDEGWTSKKGNGVYVSVSAGETKTFLLRLQGKDNQLASAEKEVEVSNLNEQDKITLEDLKKLTFTFAEKEAIYSLKIEGLENLRSKKSKLSYRISYITESKPEQKIDYNQQQSIEIDIPSKLNLVIKSDGIDVLTFAIEHMKETELKQKSGEKVIQGFLKDVSYEKKENGSYVDLTGIQEGELRVDDFGTFTFRVKGEFGELDIENVTSVKYVKLSSLPIEVKVEKKVLPSPPSVYYPDYSVNPPVESEETKKEEKPEEAKKEEKKEEKVVEEPKVEEPKVEESKTEESKTEETVKPVTETVKAPKKTSVAVASKKIASILKADAGKLSISMKNATVTLPKGILETVFAEEAGSLKVSVKTVLPKEGGKDEKAIEKRLKKNRLLSKDIYHLSVKVGKESLNQYDLNGEKFTVTLQTKLKNAPKKLYVMNLSNGKLIKVKFKAGEVKFKTELAGKFVLVTK